MYSRKSEGRERSSEELQHYLDISSNINEVIKTVLNFFLLFYEKTLHAQKAQKEHKAQKALKT